MLPQYIIAIGGSAGSLESLKEFFDQTPLNNASYIILRHLPATYQSELTQILQQHSKLKVVEASRGVPIKNNEIYYAPPKYQLAMEDGTLQLVERPGGPNRAIDIFMKSLALNENNKKMIAIIFSGLGHDGVEGVAEIKKAGGLVLVQQPDSCLYPELPLAVIKSGNANFILLPKEMPLVIMNYVSRLVLD